MEKNPNQLTRHLHPILNVYSTAPSLILHIYPLANFNISLDPVLAEVLDKNYSRWQVSKKQNYTSRQNLIMHFGKKEAFQIIFSPHTDIYSFFTPKGRLC